MKMFPRCILEWKDNNSNPAYTDGIAEYKGWELRIVEKDVSDINIIRSIGDISLKKGDNFLLLRGFDSPEYAEDAAIKVIDLVEGK